MCNVIFKLYICVNKPNKTGDLKKQRSLTSCIGVKDCSVPSFFTFMRMRTEPLWAVSCAGQRVLYWVKALTVNSRYTLLSVRTVIKVVPAVCPLCLLNMYKVISCFNGRCWHLTGQSCSLTSLAKIHLANGESPSPYLFSFFHYTARFLFSTCLKTIQHIYMLN